MEHIAADGSLLYIESYVSSTVREKQALALKTSREKKSVGADTAQAKLGVKMGKLKKESEYIAMHLIKLSYSIGAFIFNT